MRDKEYYDYQMDDIRVDTSHDTGYAVEDNTQDYGGHEGARSAVERFLESDTSDYISGYERRRRDRIVPPRLDEAPSVPEPIEDTWRPTSHYDEDEEYMSRLANARRERQRRREQNPIPTPAVRVNVDRPRSEVESDYESGVEWATLEDKDFNTFRQRYSGQHVLSEPREARIREPRPRGSVPLHRREPEPAAEGASPLRYMLAFIFVGVLALMAFLAINNRTLRRDLEAYQAQIARIEDNTAEMSRLEFNNLNYQEQIAELEGQVTDMQQQLYALGHGVTTTSAEDTDADASGGTTNARPSTDETPVDNGGGTADTTTQAQAPAQEHVIHVVQPGDMLSRIAFAHFGSSAQAYVDKIVAANDNISNPNDIRVGQEVIIPIQ